MSPMRRRILVIAVFAVIYLIPITQVQIGFGNDYCAVYYGARLIIEGQSPYGPENSAYLGDLCIPSELGVGYPFPLPFGLLTVPLALLPFYLSALIWTLIGIFLAFCCFLLVKEWPPFLLLSVLYVPLFRGAFLSQATLVWFGFSILLLIAIERRWWWVAGLCIALLPWKPQAGLLFALAGCWWAWRNDRRALLLGVGLNGLLVGITFLVQPGWLVEWIAQLNVYREVVYTQWIGLWAIPLMLVCWRLPWWARIGILQFTLFPVNDPYAALPLILVWLSIGGWTAVIGAASSWLYPFLLQAGSDKPWWVFIIPALVATGWQFWRQTRMAHSTRDRE